MNQTRKILVTTALPYANGPMHLGHILEQVQTDIWVRYQRMRDHQVHFMCAADAHGTPIMLSAQKQGMTPQALVEKMAQKQQQDFSGFYISHDHYHNTHSPENKKFVYEIYLKLRERGYIYKETINQLFDPQANMFLPDRFVKGTCPRCKATEQYGDNCDICGATYTPTDLIEPTSVISGATPELRDCEHYFFDLPKLEKAVKNWLETDAVQPEVRNKVQEWFKSGLKSWDISRDSPYFGFEIPDTPGKYLYVWLDAPIGYISTFYHYCQQNPHLDFDAFWQEANQTEVHHFIGKDIINFHCLFWPAMLSAVSYRLPTKITAHGYITLNGQKMSKSKGVFITAAQYLKHLDPEYLRYYFAAKLKNSIDDLDFSETDFIQRVNTDVINKIVNLASRNAGFIQKQFHGELSDLVACPALYKEFVDSGDYIAQAFEKREYASAIREIIRLADLANQYVDKHAPWVLAKEKELDLELQQVCSMGLNLFKVIMTYLKPVMPNLVQRCEQFMNQTFTWENRCTPLTHHHINTFKTLMPRIDPKKVASLLTEPKEQETTISEQTTMPQQAEPVIEPIATTIDFDTFAKVDLRVAKILDAQAVPEAKKLIKLQLDIGIEQRQVFAGIKAAYEPQDLIGKMIVVVANLTPRKMRFGLSQGMILAAGPGGQDIWILETNENTKPGMRVG